MIAVKPSGVRKPKKLSNRLTYSQLLSEHRPLSQRRAVPPAVPELVLALVDAQLGAFADDDDGVGATLAEGPLTGGQSWDLVADYVGTQSHHRGQGPAETTKRFVSNQSEVLILHFYIKLSRLMVNLLKSAQFKTEINWKMAKSQWILQILSYSQALTNCRRLHILHEKEEKRQMIGLPWISVSKS